MESRINIKVAMLESGLKAYQVARQMGMSESKFSRIMREPTEKQANEIMNVINEMKKGVGA